MKNDGKLARHRDLGLLGADPLGKTEPLCLQRQHSLDSGQRHPRRVVALLTRILSAEAARRASRHTTGRPRARNPCHGQVESKPLSSPTRTAEGARFPMNLAIVSGVAPTLVSQTTSPQASTTHTKVSFNETSKPSYRSMAAVVFARWNEAGSRQTS